jgi:hypothetical protein
MAGLNYVISGLDLLEDYPHIKEYIKNFDGAGGFMYTTNTDTHYNADIEKQMSDILDANGTHSGSSWGCMMRGIQAVFNGTYTRQCIEQKIVDQQSQYDDFMRRLELERAKIEFEQREIQREETQMEETQREMDQYEMDQDEREQDE